MNLTIDIGNSRNKIAVFNNDEIIDIITKETLSISDISEILSTYPKINYAILSRVKNIDSTIISYLKSNTSYFIDLDENSKIPIENLYQTKNTLGKDRLAAVIGANNIFPNTSVLVIDAGTAITFDFINKNNQYEGGTISPGLEMRFKSLNYYTNKLPLLNKNEDFNLIADNTANAIVSGVQNGIIFEIDSYINTLKNKYNDLKIFLTGGDAIFFDKKLKNTIFVNLNLNNIGLNKILEHNKSHD
ncbi:MAG: type III pantothenate kinase [Bacteroidales bacterium]|jgi:type III pantothenate kinase|nr:type III pantothenate kinase [Bacteroidales bacterium]